MTTMAAVSKERHEHKFWQRYTSYAFASKEHLVPIVAAELSTAIHAMPLAFARHQDMFFLVGIMSLKPGQNLFVNHAGKYMGAYVPSYFRSYPFKLGKTADTDKHILCVDEDSGLISETEGEPFFDPAGEPANPIRDIMKFLTKVEQNRAVTAASVSALAGADLMTPWALQATESGEQVAGLYRIDEKRMSVLEDDAFLTLRASLPIAYAQLYSMGNMAFLHKLAAINAQVEQPQEPESLNPFDKNDIFHF